MSGYDTSRANRLGESGNWWEADLTPLKSASTTLRYDGARLTVLVTVTVPVPLAVIKGGCDGQG